MRFDQARVQHTFVSKHVLGQWLVKKANEEEFIVEIKYSCH
jgi:hypothetical protein